MVAIISACFLMILLVNPVDSFQEPPADPEPGAPTNLQASVSGDNIYLTWAPPSYSGDSAITSYILYRGESSGALDYSREAFTTSFEDMEVDPGATYYYQVSARNDQGEGERSNEISFTIEVPKWTVSGRVTDPDSDEGVSDAHLVFYKQDPPQDQFDTRTDGSGQYSIELPEGNYEVRIEAEDRETIEEYTYISGPQTKDFSFEEEGDFGDLFGDINITDILGINEDEVEKWAMRAAVAVGTFICALPFLLFLITIYLSLILMRLGKIRKELRARNEKDGLFISKRRKKKLEKKEKKEKEEKPPEEEEVAEVEVKKAKKKEQEKDEKS